MARTFVNGESQTEVSEYNDPEPLRRDFAGVIGEVRVDDRNVLMS